MMNFDFFSVIAFAKLNIKEITEYINKIQKKNGNSLKPSVEYILKMFFVFGVSFVLYNANLLS